MKRLLAVLFAFCCPAMAFANVAVVNMPFLSTIGSENLNWQQGLIVADMRMHGVTVDVYSWQSLKTTWAATGVVDLGDKVGGDFKSYDVVMLIGVRTGATMPAQYLGLGVRADSLHYAARWPSVPLIMVASPEHGCRSFSDQAGGGDTLGVTDCFPDGNFNWIGSAYFTGGPYRWKAFNIPIKPLIATTPRVSDPTRQGGIYRVVVGYAQVPNVGTYSGGGLVPAQMCCNVDSIPNAVANPDSTLLFVRYRSVGDKAPIIHVHPSGGMLTDLGLVRMALAIADSVTGGKVYQDRTKLPVPRVFALHSGSSANNYVNAAQTDAGGPDPKVTTHVELQAGDDSLTAHGIKRTVYVDPESLNAATREGDAARILTRSVLVHIGLESRAGVIPNGTYRSGGVGRCIDPFGHQFVRTFIPPGATGLPASCANDSGSIYCGLIAGFNGLTAKYGASRLDHVVLPLYLDWSPLSVNKAYAPTDSIAMAAAYGGATGIITSPTAQNVYVGMAWSTTNGFDATPTTAPAGYDTQSGRLNYTMGTTRGALPLLSYRFEPAGPESLWYQGHDIRQEFMIGQANRSYYWYLSLGGASGNLGFYRHQFFMQTPGFIMNASSIGGVGGGVSGQVPAGRPGFWFVKWEDDEMKAVDALLPKWPDGTAKHLDYWTTGDDVARLPYRDGLSP